MFRRPDARNYSGSGFDVFDIFEPAREYIGLMKGVHEENVSIWIQKSTGLANKHVAADDP
jgi:uncharacterized membrane protein